jgi:hypothetical protein
MMAQQLSSYGEKYSLQDSEALSGMSRVAGTEIVQDALPAVVLVLKEQVEYRRSSSGTVSSAGLVEWMMVQVG